MGKIIETLTTMFMQPSQPKAEAEAANTTKTVPQHYLNTTSTLACSIDTKGP